MKMTKGKKGAIAKKSKGRCWYCGANKKITIDHIVPVSRGGTGHLRNLVLACKTCNSSKGSKDLSEFRRLLSRRALGIPTFNDDQLFWLMNRGINLFQEIEDRAATYQFHFEMEGYDHTL